jgi:hypothetical protein
MCSVYVAQEATEVGLHRAAMWQVFYPTYYLVAQTGFDKLEA